MTAAPPDGSVRLVRFERERGVCDIRVIRDVAHVIVDVGDGPDSTLRFQRIFHILSVESIPIFLIKLHRTAVTFAVSGSQAARAESSLSGVAETCKTRRGLALVSIVAASMRDLTGVMVSIADSLHLARTRLFAVGDSHNSVQCLIEGGHVEDAVAELKRKFELFA